MPFEFNSNEVQAEMVLEQKVGRKWLQNSPKICCEDIKFECSELGCCWSSEVVFNSDPVAKMEHRILDARVLNT